MPPRTVSWLGLHGHGWAAWSGAAAGRPPCGLAQDILRVPRSPALDLILTEPSLHPLRPPSSLGASEQDNRRAHPTGGRGRQCDGQPGRGERPGAGRQRPRVHEGGLQPAGGPGANGWAVGGTETILCLARCVTSFTGRAEHASYACCPRGPTGRDGRALPRQVATSMANDEQTGELSIAVDAFAQGSLMSTTAVRQRGAAPLHPTLFPVR